MNKTTKIVMTVVLAIIIIAVVAIVVVLGTNSKDNKTNLPKVESNEDLVEIVDKVYEKNTVELYGTISSMPIDLTDEASVKSITGLENGDKLEFAVVSEPMISSQAYSLVIAKVKDGVNADEVAKAMFDGINPRKWICVSAEKVYATSSGNIVFLVMTEKEKAQGVYESFKSLAGEVKQEYEKDVEDGELPPDTDNEVKVLLPE